MQDARCRMQDARCRMQDARGSMQAPVNFVHQQGTKSRTETQHFLTLDFRLSDFGLFSEELPINRQFTSDWMKMTIRLLD